MKRILILLISVCVTGLCTARDVTVCIYANTPLKQLQFSVYLGKYKLLDEHNNTVLQLNQGEDVIIASGKHGITIHQGNKRIGTYQKVNAIGSGVRPICKIIPEQTQPSIRLYDDHLEISTKGDVLRLLNRIDIEKYVSGVIESEALGASDEVGFYQVQAIISRTYAMEHIYNHRKDGYNLCDNVHCQVYRGQNGTAMILQSTAETAGIVLVDAHKKMITAAFHSNSGGQTVAAEDVWRHPTSYLKSVRDTFSLGCRNSTWQKEYTVREWLNLLEKHYNYDISNRKKRAQALNFPCNERQLFFAGDIPVKQMRTDLGLKSTFFSVRTEDDKVILDGRGYGHGVGLSQEGAARMIKCGFSVEEVLKFYYVGVQLVHLNTILNNE
ncbi:hypothetical protein FACS1894201_09240 [Bacteroidia bacterium]|nr:hypothetical protein FACS1894201_09240 [Bacteroidia bacterium]